MRKALWLLGWPLRAVLLAPIALYRRALGPALGARCRFHPSCSAYAAEAIRSRGALVGSALAVWRVVRCSPLTAGGPDPVPQRREAAPSMWYDSVIPTGGR